MPNMKRDSHSGAIIFEPTAEEIAIKTLQKKYTSLEEKFEELNTKYETLEKTLIKE